MSILDTVVDRGYYGFADNDMGRVAVHKAIQELADLRATVAALTARVAELESRDAYKLGARDGWKRAVVFHVDMLGEDDPEVLREIDSRWPLDESQPPTEHDAAEDHRSYSVEAWHELHEFDGVKCACDCGCDRDADRYVDDLPSCEFCAKLSQPTGAATNHGRWGAND